jgi:uncharacterized iron-regulated membrane protein/outer membrane receptor for ferrienterochelin and colicin
MGDRFPAAKSGYWHSPRTSRTRRFLFQLHLWAGLGTGLLALVAGISGAALVYAPELELAPQWSSAAASRSLPFSELSRRALAAYPGYRLQDVRFDDHGNATQMHLQKVQGPEKGGATRPADDLRLVIDPATGVIVKAVNRHAGFWHFLRQLHHNLLGGKTGRIVNGVGALLLLSLCLTGLAIWWPGPKLWKKRLSVQRGTGWKRFNWDLHNAAGFWVSAALAFFAFTGAYFAFPETYKAGIRLVTGAEPPPRKPVARKEAPADQRRPVEAILAGASAQVPDGQIRQVKFPKKPDEPMEVRIKTPFDWRDDGNNKVFVDSRTGEILRVERFDRMALGNKLIAAMEPLHMARFMTPGWPSVAVRLFWVVAGLAPGLLFLTGFLMWWNRVAGKRARQLLPARTFAPGRAVRAASLVALGLILAAFAARAQEIPSLSGTVADTTGAAIEGARVVLQTSPERSVRSGADGRFVFPRVPPGAYVVQIEAQGFEPLVSEIRAGAGAATFTLQPARFVQEIVVNAGTYDQIKLDDPVPQAGLTRADIATRNNRRLSDVVARMPGVFMSGPPGGDKDVRLRGLDKEFTRTQVDGVMIPDGGEKRELQLNRIPSSTVESVRIIRNPTAEFESDGLAGRVEVQTRPIPERFHLDGRAGYGARRNSLANDIAQGQLSGGRRFGKFGFFGTFDYLNDILPINRERTLVNRDREIEGENQRQRSPNFFGNFGAYSERFGDIHVRPVYMNFDTSASKFKETRNAAGVRTRRESESEEKNQRTLGLTLNHRLARASGFILDTQGGWFGTGEEKDKNKQTFRVAPDGSYTPDRVTLEPEIKQDKTWVAQSAATMPFRALFWHETKFGGSLRLRNRFRDKSRFEILPSGLVRNTSEGKDRYRLAEDYWAGFVQDRLRLTDRLSLTPGVRVERVDLRTAAGAVSAAPRVFVDINSSAHLLYRVTDRLSVRAAASRGLNRPKFDELSPFENVSSTKIVIGNPDLNPARAWSYDAGWDYATRLVTVSVNGFRKTIRGVIEEVDTGVERDLRRVFQVLNVGNGWTRGLEFEQRFRMPSTLPPWLRRFSFWANQTVLSSNLREYGGRERPFKEQPRWLANFGGDYNDEKYGTSLSVMSNLVARRFDYKRSGDIGSVAGTTSIDVALYQKIYGRWRLFFEGNNLTNRDRIQDEMFLNGTTTRRRETFGRTALMGVQFML